MHIFSKRNYHSSHSQHIGNTVPNPWHAGAQFQEVDFGAQRKTKEQIFLRSIFSRSVWGGRWRVGRERLAETATCGLSASWLDVALVSPKTVYAV